jgi:Spy/CpxP family protein refolding chaperone
MNWAKIILCSAGFSLMTSALVAQGSGPGMAGGPCQGQGDLAFQGGHMAHLLNLTEAQKSAMKAVADRHQASLDAKIKAAGEARNALRTAMLDPAASDDQVKALQSKAGEAQLPAMLERRAMMRESEAVLTPDQQAVLKQRRAPGSGMGHGMGKGMGHGMGQGGCGMPGMGGI